ncbi:hypothetical protein J7I93_22210 [Bacillus sp. ISL-47]|uniref:hypothetical protein n=1 Tax=Bacillus sp. ISL-47 TaxID=2819130 RepID=UPI001BEA3E4F|nr:hypothetical protein [Bacillus sp. ISL-47]MBT2690856.1 hypothetical protein [Bacillus sp. ISL-47]MBT2710983.1 hypothetical protein [Pseudomonas sp. ISL-84]
MKKLLILVIPFLTIFFISACKQTNFEDEALQIGKEYKEMQYTIKDYENPPDITEKSKTYLTEDEYERTLANRVFELITEAAVAQKISIEPEDIVFEKFDTENEKDKIRLNYKMIIIGKENSGEVRFRMKTKGQMTVIQTEDGIKISRDWDESISQNELPKLHSE